MRPAVAVEALIEALERLIADIAEAYEADETLTPDGAEVRRARAVIAKVRETR
jgi:hypothetical protein